MTQQKKQLNILMIAPEPWFQPRGTPFSVLHRIKAITSLGHHVDLVTYPIGEDIPMENLSIHRSIRLPFVKKVKIGPSFVKLLLDIPLFFSALRLMSRNKYDILHTHEEASFFGTLLARKYNVSHLYDMHSSLPQQLRNFKYTNSKLIYKLFEKLEKVTLENAKGIITICPELYHMVKAGYPQKNSILIENVGDNSLVFGKETIDLIAMREKYSIGAEKIILYSGTFEPYQGLELLIDSAQFLFHNDGPNAQYVIVGGAEHQIEKYRSLVKSKGLDSRFVFTGHVQPRTMPAFIELSHVLVSPRLGGSNSPLKIYSYLRSGKPIVATRHITHTQILDDNVALLAEPDPSAFANAIKIALEDSKRKNSMVRAAQKLARERYSYEDYIKKTNWIIQQTLN
ncbi:glycosyltransferase family 4 protein [candidate division KSB1 bacterium]|nr:glycosyltransferase family 4 protein [candidate division KSB1 bacterium]